MLFIRDVGMEIDEFLFLPVHGSMFCDQKCFVLMFRFQHLLSRFLPNVPLPLVSRQPRLSDKGDDERETGGRAVSHG